MRPSLWLPGMMYSAPPISVVSVIITLKVAMVLRGQPSRFHEP